MTSADYLVVGSGLTGSTIARLLADADREVVILDRRLCPGGNVRDFDHASGIRVHAYGPHYFRCSSPVVWDFVTRFSEFYLYSAKVAVRLDGQYLNWPVTHALLDQYRGWEARRPSGKPRNFEEACLQKMPRPVYDALVKGYTRRQWGLEPRHLKPNLADRIRINGHGETTLTPHQPFQGLPAKGYSRMMEHMLQGIPCRWGVDYLQARTEYTARRAIVFSGPIDEYFGFAAGRLGYRSQQRFHEYFPDREQYQPFAQVNHADADATGLLRTLEWKHLMLPREQARMAGTVVTWEHPFTPQNPDTFEYPVPTKQNTRLYEHYRRLAAAVPKLIACGRLGTYRYLDMDHAISRAMQVAGRLLKQKSITIHGRNPTGRA